jgi:hypothetical protein
MKNKEFGKRFKEACQQLNEMGVFYGKGYSKKYHEKYPHSINWFALGLDQHRGGFESCILKEGDVERIIHTARNLENPEIAILELLENTYTILKNEGLNEETE